MNSPALRIRVFQHVAFEGVGSLAPWLGARGHSLSYTRFFAGESPPGPEAFDWLIVMGGPMGVHDEALFPWLNAEKRALEAALKAGRPVLGVCLGAQLLADVLGAPVTRNPQAEIGWFPVELGPEARGTWMAEAFPARFTPLHWHGDTFQVPAGAVPLGFSEACRNQGFLYGRALALQFHPEVTRESLEALIAACGDELRPGPFVEDAEGLRRGLVRAPELNAMMAKACEFLEPPGLEG